MSGLLTFGLGPADVVAKPVRALLVSVEGPRPLAASVRRSALQVTCAVERIETITTAVEQLVRAVTCVVRAGSLQLTCTVERIT